MIFLRASALAIAATLAVAAPAVGGSLTQPGGAVDPAIETGLVYDEPSGPWGADASPKVGWSDAVATLDFAPAGAPRVDGASPATAHADSSETGTPRLGVFSSLPEPLAWVMMLVGFLGAGAALRHGRRGGGGLGARAPRSQIGSGRLEGVRR